MRLEGELRVGLRLQAGRIGSVGIRSTRPDIAQTLLIGRSVTEAQAAVPVLFSICGRSQATASRLACAAAAGLALSDGALAEAQAAVAAETVREIAWHTLLNWAQWLGEEPAPKAVAAARAAMGFRWGSDAGPAPLDIALAAFGCTAAEWLQLQTWSDLQRWAADGGTTAARFIHSLVITNPSGAECDAAVAQLPQPHADWLVPLAETIESDAGFAQRPTWQGAPAETGALARRQGDPLFDPAGMALGTRAMGRSGLRFVARLRELAQLLASPPGAPAPVGLGALALGAGGGLAWVDNARGLLLHHARLSQDRVIGYRIVAPTEWNFHPRGPLAAALEGACVDDAKAASALATRVVHALDPCVACRVEIDDA